MVEPRLSTVYDFSSLRLHPDGSRVQQESARNRRPRVSRVSTRDVGGNWIARDAGGVAAVPQYRKHKSRSEVNEDEAEVLATPVGGSQSEGEEVEDLGRRLRGRPAKRQKFLHNMDYLEPTVSAEVPSQGVVSPISAGPPLALPSSDMLKCIHHLASMYYHEHGQLFDASREYRQERRLEKLRDATRSERPAISGSSSYPTEPRQQNENEDKEEGDDDVDDSVDRDIGVDDPGTITRAQRLKGRTKSRNREKKNHRRDMYRMFDGSAMMAIGMLVQEHVARMLEPRVPERWEESMVADSSFAEDDEGQTDRVIIEPESVRGGGPKVGDSDSGGEQAELGGSENSEESEKEWSG